MKKYIFMRVLRSLVSIFLVTTLTYTIIYTMAVSYTHLREGAAIFFAPDNPVSEEEQKAHPDAKNNYQTALEAAKTIKTDMKIVPVKTLQDAIDYLKNNP